MFGGGLCSTLVRKLNLEFPYMQVVIMDKKTFRY